MKFHGLYLTCPCCGRRLSWSESLFTGYVGRLHTCRKCGQKTVISRKLRAAKTHSYNAMLLALFYPACRISGAIFVWSGWKNVKWPENSIRGFSLRGLVFLPLFCAMWLPLAILWCVIFHRRIPWVAEDQTYGQREREEDSAWELYRSGGTKQAEAGNQILSGAFWVIKYIILYKILKKELPEPPQQNDERTASSPTPDPPDKPEYPYEDR